MLYSHVCHSQRASLDHCFVIRFNLRQVCAQQPVHLAIRGAFLENEQHVDLFDQRPVHRGVPRLRHSSGRRRQRLPVILDVRYDFFVFAEHGAVGALLGAALLQVGQGGYAHLRYL